MAESEALRFVRDMYRHGMCSGGHSWCKLNAALRGALSLAIESRMAFAPNDFARIFETCAGEHWMGTDHDGDGYGEGFYRTACIAGNPSACQAFERWRQRPPYLWAGKRLYVGSDEHNRTCGFPWDGYAHVAVSTIRPDVLIATYKEGHWGPAKRIWRIPHETFVALEHLRRRMARKHGWQTRDWRGYVAWLAERDAGKPVSCKASVADELQQILALLRPNGAPTVTIKVQEDAE